MKKLNSKGNAQNKHLGKIPIKEEKKQQKDRSRWDKLNINITNPKYDLMSLKHPFNPPKNFLFS